MPDPTGDDVNWVDPETVILALATAVPADWRRHTVVIGSLAAGFASVAMSSTPRMVG